MVLYPVQNTAKGHQVTIFSINASTRNCILYRAATRFTKLNRRITSWVKNQDTVPSVFTKLLKKHPDKVLFYFEDDTWTFKQVNSLKISFCTKGLIFTLYR